MPAGNQRRGLATRTGMIGAHGRHDLQQNSRRLAALVGASTHQEMKPCPTSVSITEHNEREHLERFHDGYRGLECDIGDLSSMADVVSRMLEEALSEDARTKPMTYFIPHTNTLLFCAYHLQEMIDALKAKYHGDFDKSPEAA